MDEYRFTPEDDVDPDGPMWSSPEEERTFRRVRDLLVLLHERGMGVTLRPVAAGMRSGGFGSDHEFALDGWEVGYFHGMGGGDIAVGASLDQALQAAIAIESSAATTAT